MKYGYLFLAPALALTACADKSTPATAPPPMEEEHPGPPVVLEPSNPPVYHHHGTTHRHHAKHHPGHPPPVVHSVPYHADPDAYPKPPPAQKHRSVKQKVHDWWEKKHHHE